VEALDRGNSRLFPGNSRSRGNLDELAGDVIRVEALELARPEQRVGRRRLYRSYWKFRARIALGSYGRAMPRSIMPRSIGPP
jgi:hypothetical protein